MFNKEEDISFHKIKQLFVPLTNVKAVTIIAIVGFIVYFNMLFNGFVWDDHFQIVNNIHVQSGEFFYYFTHTIGPYYRPFMLAAYTVFFQFFQLHAFFYHFFQITIHIINAVFIFWILKYFSKQIQVSFLLSVLFLIHPINVEPVVYIANLQDVLFVLFGLSAFIITIKKVFGKYSSIISAVLLLLSLFSKETGILFAIMYCIYIVCFKKTQRIYPILYALGASMGYIIIRVLLVGPIRSSNGFNFTSKSTILAATFSQRLLTIPHILAFYLTTFIYPVNLTAQYWYVKTITVTNFFLPLAFDSILFVFLFYLGVYLQKIRNNKATIYWFFFVWFCIGLAFHSQVLPLEKTVTDRWFYFPSIGLLGLIATAIPALKIKLSKAKIKALILAVSILYALLALRTVIRSSNWYSDISLFGHDIATMQDVADIQYNYASVLLNNGQYSEAIVHFQKAGVIEPNAYQVWQNLGVAYANERKFDKAEENFKKAISLSSKNNPLYRSLGTVFILENKPEESRKIDRAALKKWPRDAILWRILGLAEYQLHNTKNAENDFQKSLTIEQNSITQYYELNLRQGLAFEIKEL